jgi:hypothetical protein
MYEVEQGSSIFLFHPCFRSCWVYVFAKIHELSLYKVSIPKKRGLGQGGI